MKPFQTHIIAVGLSIAAFSANLGVKTAYATEIVIPIPDTIELALDGRVHGLDVLVNDIDYDPENPPLIEIVQAPECLQIEIANSKLFILAQDDCPAEVHFEYCVQTEIGCLAADVAVYLPEIAQRQQVEADADISAEEAAENTAIEFDEGQEGGAVEETPSTSSDEMNRSEENIDLPNTDLVDADALETDLVAEQAAVQVVSIDPPAISPISRSTTRAVFNLEELRQQILESAEVTNADECPVRLEIVDKMLGSTDVQLESQCRSGELSLVLFDGQRYLTRLDETGIGRLRVYHLTDSADFVAQFADGAQAQITIKAEEMKQLRRVALLWDQFWDAELELHALEFGAKIGEEGHVWHGTTSRSAIGNHLMTLTTELGGQNKAFYTIRNTGLSVVNAVELQLDELPCARATGRQISYRVVVSQGGTIVEDFRRLTAPSECENADAATPLKVALLTLVP